MLELETREDFVREKKVEWNGCGSDEKELAEDEWIGSRRSEEVSTWTSEKMGAMS